MGSDFRNSFQFLSGFKSDYLRFLREDEDRFDDEDEDLDVDFVALLRRREVVVDRRFALKVKGASVAVSLLPKRVTRTR